MCLISGHCFVNRDPIEFEVSTSRTTGLDFLDALPFDFPILKLLVTKETIAAMKLYLTTRKEFHYI